jgi:hypothetical protein
METGLEGRAVLVTEAMCNHGRASALAFAGEGANLQLCTPAAPIRQNQVSLEAHIKQLVQLCRRRLPFWNTLCFATVCLLALGLYFKTYLWA